MVSLIFLRTLISIRRKADIRDTREKIFWVRKGGENKYGLDEKRCLRANAIEGVEKGIDLLVFTRV